MYFPSRWGGLTFYVLRYVWGMALQGNRWQKRAKHRGRLMLG
jgi:hypothetical protein